MEFSNTYITLGESFYQQAPPTPVSDPRLFLWNPALAGELGLSEAEQQDTDTLAAYFSGNQMPAGAEPLSAAYAGHQFGGFSPQLGDGRAHLLGEIVANDGNRRDVQLKGSGPTAFSRGGDGRCAIGPAVREFIMSEAMAALGVPTTRCLAVVTTGESVYRKTGHPGAVVTRVATSHIRVGTFQYFAARKETASLQKLFDYTVERHYPDVASTDVNPVVALLDQAMQKQIELIVAWMRVGFIHGVMNTDNTALSGETIDFGPCAMMGVYGPTTVYSSIDNGGRYAFGNQPAITHWNIVRLAESLLPLVDREDETLMMQVAEVVNGFPQRYQDCYQTMLAGKCGIADLAADDEVLMEALLQQFAEQKLDYTITFDLMTRSLTCDESAEIAQEQLGEIYTRWRTRIEAQTLPVADIQTSMRRSNPVVIPRNHHIEAVLADCEASGKPDAALAILEVLRQPYKEITGTEQYQSLPEDGDRYYRTFCGT